MLLEFTQEEYDSIPSPKRTHVMRWYRRGRKDELREEMLAPELRWAFLIDGRCQAAVGRTKGEAFRALGYGDGDYDRIERHGRYEDAVRDGWWVEAGEPGTGPLEV